MSQTRSVWADLLRIVAMFFVVFIHVSPLPQSIHNTNILYFINFAIVKTCIALFFMMSGALLLGKQESYKAFFQKRFFKVIFPWLIWTLIYMIVQVIVQGHTVSDWKYFFELTFFTKFWILPVLAGLYLLTPLFRILIKHAKPRDIHYLLFLWFTFISLLPFFHNGQAFPISFPAGLVSQVMMCSGFFLGGYYISLIAIKYTSAIYSLTMLFLGTGLTVITAIVHPHEIESFAYSIFAPGMVLSAIGILLLFKSFDERSKHFSFSLKQLIQSISIATFGVYVTHELLYNFFKYIIPINNLLLKTDLLTDYVRALIIFILATLIVIGIQKIPYLKKIVP